MKDVEEWRPIGLFHGGDWTGMYEASSLGRVRSLDRIVHTSTGPRKYQGKLLRLIENDLGRQLVSLSDVASGAAVKAKVHRLVAFVFMGACPPGLEVCHIDGDKHNNRSSNLKYATRAENGADRVGHLGGNKGERHGLAKLTEKSVLEIRQRAASGETRASLALGYGVSQAAIGHVIRRSRWGWLEATTQKEEAS